MLHKHLRSCTCLCLVVLLSGWQFALRHGGSMFCIVWLWFLSISNNPLNTAAFRCGQSSGLTEGNPNTRQGTLSFKLDLILEYDLLGALLIRGHPLYFAIGMHMKVNSVFLLWIKKNSCSIMCPVQYWRGHAYCSRLTQLGGLHFPDSLHSNILCYWDLDRARLTPPPWLQWGINAAAACPHTNLKAYWCPNMKGLGLVLLVLLLLFAVVEGKQRIERFFTTLWHQIDT